MIITRTLLFTFLLGSCGPNVNFKNNDLATKSQLTSSELERFQKLGTISKTSSQTIIDYEGRSYVVSIYSSKLANDFIAALPIGSNFSIKFTGGTSRNEINLETIKRH